MKKKLKRRENIRQHTKNENTNDHVSWKTRADAGAMRGVKVSVTSCFVCINGRATLSHQLTIHFIAIFYFVPFNLEISLLNLGDLSRLRYCLKVNKK